MATTMLFRINCFLQAHGDLAVVRVGGASVINWIVEGHPYIASILLVLVLFSIGYLESRAISPGSACFTWIWIVIGVSAAAARVSAIGRLRWVLAALILISGSSWVLHYYRRHNRGTNP